MAISSKRKVALLQFLNSFKAHTVSLGIIHQHRPRKLADPCATWQTHTQHIKKSKVAETKRHEFVVPVHLVFLDLFGRLTLWNEPMKISHVQYHLTSRRPV